MTQECGQPLEARKGKETDSPLEPAGEGTLLGLDFSPVRPVWVSEPQNYQTIHLCCC